MTKDGQRLFELDALRGLAALFVVLFHYTTKYQELYGHTSAPLVNFSYGHYGVNLFFMISGFVIFMTLEKTRNTMDFVVSRFSRLYPAYWTAILLTSTVVGIFELPDKEVTPLEILFNFTMLQELFKIRHVDNVYWTLQIELIFYVLMLIFYQLDLLEKIERVLFAWLAIRLAYLVAPIFFNFELPHIVGKLAIQAHIPYFALGIVFYRAKQLGAFNSRLILLCAASLLLIYVGSSFLTFVMAGFFSFVFRLFVHNGLSLLRWPPFGLLGTLSYSLYLLHENIGWAIIYRFEGMGWSANVSIALAITVSLTLSALVTYFIEKPAMTSIRSRYRARRPLKARD